MPVGSLLLCLSGARPVGFDVALGCRLQQSDDEPHMMRARSLIDDAFSPREFMLFTVGLVVINSLSGTGRSQQYCHPPCRIYSVSCT